MVGVGLCGGRMRICVYMVRRWRWVGIWVWRGVFGRVIGRVIGVMIDGRVGVERKWYIKCTYLLPHEGEDVDKWNKAWVLEQWYAKWGYRVERVGQSGKEESVGGKCL